MKHKTMQTQTCHICKGEHPAGKDSPPTGICTSCQKKIAVILLVIMVTTTGMIFFGLI